MADFDELLEGAIDECSSGTEGRSDVRSDAGARVNPLMANKGSTGVPRGSMPLSRLRTDKAIRMFFPTPNDGFSLDQEKEVQSCSPKKNPLMDPAAQSKNHDDVKSDKKIKFFTFQPVIMEVSPNPSNQDSKEEQKGSDRVLSTMVESKNMDEIHRATPSSLQVGLELDKNDTNK